MGGWASKTGRDATSDLCHEMQRTRQVAQPVLDEVKPILKKWNDSALYNKLTQASDVDISSLMTTVKMGGGILVGSTAVAALAGVTACIMLGWLKRSMDKGFRHVVSAVEQVNASIELGNVMQMISMDQNQPQERKYLVDPFIEADHVKMAKISAVQDVSAHRVTVMSPLRSRQTCLSRITTMWLHGGSMHSNDGAELQMDETSQIVPSMTPMEWQAAGALMPLSRTLLRISGLRVTKLSASTSTIHLPPRALDYLIIDSCLLHCGLLFSDGAVGQLRFVSVYLHDTQLVAGVGAKWDALHLQQVKYRSPNRVPVFTINGRNKLHVHMEELDVEDALWGTLECCFSVVIAKQDLTVGFNLRLNHCQYVMLDQCVVNNRSLSVDGADTSAMQLLFLSCRLDFSNGPGDWQNFPFHHATFINCTFSFNLSTSYQPVLHRRMLNGQLVWDTQTKADKCVEPSW